MAKYIYIFIILCTVLMLYGGGSSGIAIPRNIFDICDDVFTNQYDDAYITYRYAVNLVNGDGLVFNVGERVDAASSFLYTVILAGFYKIGLSPEIMSIVISLLSLGIIGLLIINTAPSWYGYVIAGLVCLHGFMSGWAVSGMETVFYAMLVSLFVYCVLNNKLAWMPYIMCAVILTRHDGLLLLPVYLWYVRKKTILLIAPMLLFVFTYYFTRYAYYGDIIPHVMQVKSANPYYQANPHEMLQYWLLYGSAVLFGLIALNKKISLFIYCIIAWFVYAFGIRADLVRYSVHLLPVMILITFHGYRRINTRTLYAFIIILSLNTYMSIEKYRPFVKDYYQTQEARYLIGCAVATKIPESERIISGDIGMIAYTAINHEFADMIGLTSIPNYLTNKYIADTINARTNRYERLSGDHKLLLKYGQQGKPYAIGLLERNTE